MTHNKKTSRVILAKMLALLFLAGLNFSLHSQSTCTANITSSLSLGGNQVTYYSNSAGTTTLTNYSWSFSGGYPAVSGTGSAQVTVNYTLPGIYTATLILTSISPTCNSTATVTVIVPNCSLTVNTNSASFTSCNGSASVIAPGMCAPISYSWQSTNTVVPGTGSSQVSLCPGNYTVTASGITTGSCCPYAIKTFTIGSNTTCSLNPNFSHTVQSNGLVNFASTSTGTYAGSVYSWNFGDGPPITTLAITAHTYSTPGSYSVKLTVINSFSSGCVDSSQVAIVTPNFCALNANFTKTISPNGNGLVDFKSTSTGTTSNSVYSWNFGDGTITTGPPVISHAYDTTATYFVILTVSNSSTCVDSALAIIQVTVVCPIAAAYTHTVGTGGSVAFTSISTGVNSTSKYFWDFGDGYTAISPAPTHVYGNSGNHYVKLVVTDSTGLCRDSVIQSLNITGVPCVANSGFTLVPSGTPQYWYAIPFYPYNVTAAVWSWGDGSTSNTLYTSHVYSVSATYSICLSVTVSCGASSTYCSSYLIAKPSGTPTAGGIYSVNVQAPPLHVGLGNLEETEKTIFIYPNPGDGIFYLRTTELMVQEKYFVSDVVGKVVADFEALGPEQVLDLSHLPDGLYFISGNAIKPVKVIIAR